MTLRLQFDTTTCARCLGEGVVRPWGTCFRCGGAKVFLTAAGRRARAAWDAFSRERGIIVAHDRVEPGMVLFVPQQFVGPQNGGTYVRYKKPLRVASVDRDARPMRLELFAAKPSTPWIIYHAERGTIEIPVTPAETLKRRPTEDELREFMAKGRKGVVLVEAEPAEVTR